MIVHIILVDMNGDLQSQTDGQIMNLEFSLGVWEIMCMTE